MSEAPKALLIVGGAEFPDGIFNEIAEATALILREGFETSADQETIRAALRLVTEIAKVEHVTVTGSTFTNNPPAEVQEKP